MNELVPTDGDETVVDMMTTQERLVQSNKKKTVKPLDQEIATHEAYGCHPYRDWCRAALVALGGRTHATDGVKNKNILPVPSMDYGFFTDGDDGKPSMMIL